MTLCDSQLIQRISISRRLHCRFDARFVPFHDLSLKVVLPIHISSPVQLKVWRLSGVALRRDEDSHVSICQFVAAKVHSSSYGPLCIVIVTRLYGCAEGVSASVSGKGQDMAGFYDSRNLLDTNEGLFHSWQLRCQQGARRMSL